MTFFWNHGVFSWSIRPCSLKQEERSLLKWSKNHGIDHRAIRGFVSWSNKAWHIPQFFLWSLFCTIRPHKETTLSPKLSMYGFSGRPRENELRHGTRTCREDYCHGRPHSWQEGNEAIVYVQLFSNINRRQPNELFPFGLLNNTAGGLWIRHTFPSLPLLTNQIIRFKN